MGNVESVDKAIRHLGFESVITNDPKQISNSSFIILPGVGAFAQGMKNLHELSLFDTLNSQIIEFKKPFLGICLGMQLIASKGYEPNLTSGLGWIEGEVLKIEEKDKAVPHLGWNQLSAKENSFIKEYDQKDFYFIHSYHFEVKDSEYIAATVNYGKNYVAAVHKENIYALQFHPEKSQTSGLNLIKSIIDIYA
jgi:glutamine amidotransferase